MTGVSRRAQELGTENAFVVLAEVNELVRAGRDVISFCIGQPDFHTPVNIQDAAIKAIREGKHGYTPSAGIVELRQAVAREISATRGIAVDANDVVIAAGAKPFIGYTVLSVTDYGAGDEVIYPNPGFPIYESQIKANGAVPVPLHLRESRAFNFDPQELADRITPRTKLLILNSPHNPTGGVIPRQDMEAIAEILRKHEQVWVFADEIYGRLVYDGEFASIASLPGMQERTIVSDGCSKTWAMTGWRLGFAVNRKLAPFFTTWITNTESCASQISQWAAVEALTGPQDDARRMRDIFFERRNLIVELLNRVPGVTCQSPGGAFYVWPNVTQACAMVGAKDSEELRARLLNEAGVAVLADIHFGPRVPNEGQHIRFSYAASNDAIRKGVARMAEFIEKNRAKRSAAA
ncbi:MAG TPA: pyridoxal phosphate-dependent aminotransferase [Burkholderiales bacterium]|nr:pyridoxal phosphate-dependent aminotransferase [Burkholderiales bacterium]